MSTRRPRLSVPDALSSAGSTRGLALVATAGSLAAPLGVLYHLIDAVSHASVAGIPVTFVAAVVASLAAATVLARVVRPAVAVVLAAVLLAGGLGWYLANLTGSPPVDALLADLLDLLAGQSLFAITSIRVWVLGVTPAPVFLSWYFAVRRRYVLAVLTVGVTLGFLVLTTDADALTTLTGVVAGAAAVGLGDADRRADRLDAAEPIAVLLAVMIVVPAVVPVLPGLAGVVQTGAGTGSGPGSGSSGTLEANLLNADDRVTVSGRIELSPKVRYVVQSDRQAYWRVGSYDRYTGGGWARTYGNDPYSGPLAAPPGETTAVDQTVRVNDSASVMPAAWKPVRVAGQDDVRVWSDGSLEPGDRLDSGTTYRVRSQVPDPSPGTLQSAGRDYPDRVQQRYTQLPASTPDRVERRTDRLTANADTPYETALVIERWLENNRNYSLDVREPRGNVADTFLFEREAGYCTYFATTMVTMLRTQDIPARFVVGYTPGERVESDTWVVRGLNAHAWVEMYVPGSGWVRFDPTPAGPREDVEQQRVERARDAGTADVDASGSEAPGEWTPSPTPTPAPLTPVPENETETATPTAGPNVTRTIPDAIVTDNITGNATTATPTPADSDAGGFVPRPPTRQQLALGVVAVFGVALGVRRTGVGERAYRAVWLRYQPRRDPGTDVERAFQRLEYYLEHNNYRSREEGETVREYLDAMRASPDIRRVAAIRERARYAGVVDEAAADEAVRLVDDIVRDR